MGKLIYKCDCGEELSFTEYNLEMDIYEVESNCPCCLPHTQVDIDINVSCHKCGKWHFEPLNYKP